MVLLVDHPFTHTIPPLTSASENHQTPIKKMAYLTLHLY